MPSSYTSSSSSSTSPSSPEPVSSGEEDSKTEEMALFAPETKPESQPWLVPVAAPGSAGDAGASSGDRRRRLALPPPDLSSSPSYSGDRRRRAPKRDAMGGAEGWGGRRSKQREREREASKDSKRKREAILAGAPRTATATGFSGSVPLILPVTNGTTVFTCVFGAHPAEGRSLDRCLS